ncbi:helix-turn-helix transcriptional regulator [Nesterenkonia sp. CL21]|nr:helix-turn-helix transcriptional regulator [Nesterenkonia sp. CL21]
MQIPEGFVPQFTKGDRLRKARELTGLSATEFGKDIGVSRNSISRAENGDTEPRRMLMLAWAMRSGVSLKWLETGEAPSPDGDGASGESGGDDLHSSEWAPRDSNPEPAD